MSKDQQKFDPIRPAHAIERCVATIVFTENVPDRLFASIREKTIATAGKVGMANTPMTGFHIDVATGKVTTVTNTAADTPLNLATSDQAQQLSVVQNQISLSTARYVRWRPFIGEMSRVLEEPLLLFLQAVSPRAVRLEYID